MKKMTLLTLISLVIFATAFSQSGMINGKITDSATKKVLGLATITVFKAKDTSIVTYRLSNPDGDFKIPGLPLNLPLRLIATYSGYEAIRKEFTLSADKPNISFEEFKMVATSRLLDEVTVIAERPPVVVKNDTVEFNASSFKTLPNALVEDLLKKLPGVQVDADGNITVNGKPVNRILVDGKTFFGDDPKMATRNLPANVIDKVQVTDDKEQLARNGDDNLNNVGKVVNITLKKGVKKGMFGKVYAGGGNNQNYEMGGIANIFRDTFQVSLLGYANTLNKPGFNYTDLTQTGGLDRSNSNLNGRSMSATTSNNGSGISINGVNFGGIQQGGGVATSKGLGININHAPNLKQSLFAQYFYGNVMVDRRNENDVQQFNTDTITENHTLLTGGVITNAHNIGLGGKFKPDSVTTILASANYTIGLQNDNRFSTVNSNNNLLGPLSYGNINQNNKSNTYYYRHSFIYTRLSKTKKGRRFTFAHNLDINNRFNYYTTNAATHFLYPAASDSLLNQLRREALPNTIASTYFNYSEPLGKGFTIRAGGRYEYTKLNNGINTFNPNSTDQKYTVINSQLSSDFNRESNRFYITSGIEYRHKDLTITPGLRLMFQDVNNVLQSLNTSIRQKTNDLLPSFTVSYKQLTLNYSKDIVLPAYNYLIPVLDNTNPYIVARGNPNLLPSQRHNVSLNGYFNDQKTNLSMYLYASGSIIDNDIIQNITLDQRGVQTSTPVNANGSSLLSLNYNLSKQYRSNPKFIYSWNVGGYSSVNRSKLLFNGETSWQTSAYISEWAGFNMNFNDKFEWNNGGSWAQNLTHYTSKAFTPLKVTTYDVQTEMILRIPNHVIWETTIDYGTTGNIAPGFPKQYTSWRAAVNFTMLKDEKGVLRLSVYDILNSNVNVGSSVNKNVLTTSQTNVLGRYFMATFTYNIRSVGGGKRKVGGEKLFNF